MIRFVFQKDYFGTWLEDTLAEGKINNSKLVLLKFATTIHEKDNEEWQWRQRREAFPKCCTAVFMLYCHLCKGKLLWVELCPPKCSYVEVLTPTTSECDSTWREVLYRSN